MQTHIFARERDLTHTEEEASDHRGRDWSDGTQAKKCQQPTEAGGGEKWIVP